jgi:hypothetical protein
MAKRTLFPAASIESPQTGGGRRPLPAHGEIIRVRRRAFRCTLSERGLHRYASFLVPKMDPQGRRSPPIDGLTTPLAEARRRRAKQSNQDVRSPLRSSTGGRAQQRIRLHGARNAIPIPMQAEGLIPCKRTSLGPTSNQALSQSIGHTFRKRIALGSERSRLSRDAFRIHPFGHSFDESHATGLRVTFSPASLLIL